MQKTLAVDPDHVMALNLSGIMAADRKDFKQAAELFFKAASAAPGELGFWQNTIITARLAGDKKLETLAVTRYQELQHRKNVK